MSNEIHSTVVRVCVAAALATGAATAAHAQTVARDAQSGQLRAATAEETAALATKATPARGGPRGLLTGAPSPQARQLPSGELELEHDESMLNYTVVTRLPSGKLVRRCVPSAQVAQLIAQGKRTSFAKSILEISNER